MNKNLTTINKNRIVALEKSKTLLNITKNILSKKNISALVEKFEFIPFFTSVHTRSEFIQSLNAEATLNFIELIIDFKKQEIEFTEDDVVFNKVIFKFKSMPNQILSNNPMN